VLESRALIPNVKYVKHIVSKYDQSNLAALLALSFIGRIDYSKGRNTSFLFTSQADIKVIMERYLLFIRNIRLRDF
jgi:hypothetical protein